VVAAEQHLPHNAFVAAFGILVIGMVAGLEGSGFSALPLTGALARALAAATGISAAALAAVGQMGNIWSGGGRWSPVLAGRGRRIRPGCGRRSRGGASCRSSSEWPRVPWWLWSSSDGPRQNGAMTWTAPEVTRTGGSTIAGERELLPDYLAYQRSTLLHKCVGLTGAQLAERSVPPSNLSLLGLIRHLAKVERIWFRERFAGQVLAPMYDPAQGKDADFEGLDPAQADHDYARLIEEWRLPDEAVAGASLDDVFVHRGEEFSLRLVYVHMIQEYARHSGHADLLRERVDGVTGA
jgi:hypothetical protein